MRVFAGIALMLLASMLRVEAKNSDIFPATGEAGEKISWTNGYFVVNGVPTFLTAGELHYARIPRALWRDRLWRVKQMGLNTIQTYVFWNAHEPKEGQWDFSGNLDLDAFLTLAREMGLYIIVRPGPYSCAEWEHGGFPAWLSIKPGMHLRNSDPQYLHYVDLHMQKIQAIIAKHQIHKGGNVIMMQLENECRDGWGTDARSPYLNHLYDKAREAGLEIPLFFSGLNHGADPSGEAPFAEGRNYKAGGTPWYTTEFWAGWIGKYGDMAPEMLNEKIRGTWKIIAFGGAGYGYYVVHGGSNFGYSGDSTAASYDYSAAIGEAGQLNNLYAPARRAACFAQSFASILTSSSNAPTFATLTGHGGRITSRQSPMGSIVFVDNFQIPKDKKKAAQHIAPTADALQVEAAEPGMVAITTTIEMGDLGEIPRAGILTVQPHEIRTVLVDLPWTAATRFESVSANVLLRHEVGGLDTWVCYGAPGDYGEVTVKRASGTDLPAKYSFVFPTDDSVQEILIDSGEATKARFLIMNTALADRTWLVKDELVIGACFVREDGSAELPLEGGRLVVYGDAGKTETSVSAVPSGELPALKNWQWREAAKERLSDYDDSNWLRSTEAQAMETYDGFQNRYAWYRTTLQGDGQAPVDLRFMGTAGRAQVFLNGEPADLKKLNLKAGENTLAWFFTTSARPKMFGFTGEVGKYAARGMWGPTRAGDKPAVVVTDWKLLHTGGMDAEYEKFVKPDFDDKDWTAITLDPAARDVNVEKGVTWLRGVLQNTDNLKTAVAYPPELVGRWLEKKLFINGQAVSVAKDMNHPVEFSELRPGANSVVLRIQAMPVDKAFVRPQMDVWRGNESSKWKFRGGLEGLDETAVIGRVTNWKEFLSRPWHTEGAPPAALPVLWHTTFDYQAKATQWKPVGLLTDGLRAGHAWLNGHNLGEVPQKVPLYMPECWLNDGPNDLVILDVFGSNPEQVRIQKYECRQIVKNYTNDPPLFPRPLL